MNILFMTSEAAPFAASGGLGDVMGALPKALLENQEITSVSCILPLYSTMKDIHRSRLTKVMDLRFDLSWRRTGASIYALEECGVSYYFIENHYYFSRGKFYGEHDDAERFAFFSKCSISVLPARLT